MQTVATKYYPRALAFLKLNDGEISAAVLYYCRHNIFVKLQASGGSRRDKMLL